MFTPLPDVRLIRQHFHSSTQHPDKRSDECIPRPQALHPENTFPAIAHSKSPSVMSPKSRQSMQRTSGVVVVLFVLLWIGVTTSDAVPLLFPASSLLPKVEMGTPIRGPDVKLGDGDVVGGKTYIYKCKICDMPRIFVMNYGSFIV